MDRLTDLASNNDAISFKERFQQIVSDKVSTALDAERIAVAQTLFNDRQEATEGE